MGTTLILVRYYLNNVEIFGLVNSVVLPISDVSTTPETMRGSSILDPTFAIGGDLSPIIQRDNLYYILQHYGTDVIDYTGLTQKTISNVVVELGYMSNGEYNYMKTLFHLDMHTSNIGNINPIICFFADLYGGDSIGTSFYSIPKRTDDTVGASNGSKYGVRLSDDFNAEYTEVTGFKFLGGIWVKSDGSGYINTLQTELQISVTDWHYYAMFYGKMGIGGTNYYKYAEVVTPLFIRSALSGTPVSGFTSQNPYPNNVYSITPLENEKGRYKGLPTSTIPLKQTIPSDIDYRHNIVVYDETEQNARNMFLTNRVGTIPYTLIDYSVPNGTLRVATDLQFTHFVGCSFTSDNDPRIYRVVSYRVLGDNLLEYTFEMDGLKDYFQHFGITSANNFLVERCTVSTNWNKFLKDTAFYDGTFTDYVVTGSTIYNYYALNIPNGVYVVNETGFRYFCRWITEYQAQYSQAIVGQVSSVHIVPFTDDNNIYTDVGTSLTFSLADGTPITCEFPTTVYKYNVSVNVGRYNDYVQGSLPQCAEIETFRELYDSNATIHIPCYGDFTPTLDLLSRLAVGSVPFRYYIAPIDGTCAVSFYPYTEVLPVVTLPSRTLPVNNSVSAMYTVNRESALAQGMNINRGYTSMLNSALSMDVGGFLSKPVEMKVNAIEIQQTAKNSLQTIKETQSVNNVSGSGGGSIVCRVAYLSLQVPNLSIPFDDLFSSIGYPTSKLWTTIGGVSGARYYVNLLGKVKGAKWYADLVSSDINSDYIVYNY